MTAVFSVTRKMTAETGVVATEMGNSGTRDVRRLLVSHCTQPYKRIKRSDEEGLKFQQTIP